MKLPRNWKNRSKEDKARWFAQGHVSARQVGDYNGRDFVDVWLPTVRGQIVCCPLTNQSKLESRVAAIMAAVRFREMCRNIVTMDTIPNSVNS